MDHPLDTWGMIGPLGGSSMIDLNVAVGGYIFDIGSNVPIFDAFVCVCTVCVNKILCLV